MLSAEGLAIANIIEAPLSELKTRVNPKEAGHGRTGHRFSRAGHPNQIKCRTTSKINLKKYLCSTLALKQKDNLKSSFLSNRDSLYCFLYLYNKKALQICLPDETAITYFFIRS